MKCFKLPARSRLLAAILFLWKSENSYKMYCSQNRGYEKRAYLPQMQVVVTGCMTQRQGCSHWYSTAELVAVLAVDGSFVSEETCTEHQLIPSTTHINEDILFKKQPLPKNDTYKCLSLTHISPQITSI